MLVRVFLLAEKRINFDFFGFRDLHREQLSIEHSMHDLDSAVGKLDNILMSLYVIIAVLIIAVALVTRSFLMSSV